MANQDLVDKNEQSQDASDSEIKRLDKQIADQINDSNMSTKTKKHVISMMQMYSGPIPHPDILAGYQHLYPKAAERIIENGVAESEHRRKLETIRQKRRGRMAWVSLIALVVILAGITVGSFFLILHGSKVLGTIFGSLSFISLLGSLLGYVDKLSSSDDWTQRDSEKSSSDSTKK
ncbi:MAG: DUF2335 domain-containing protein [Lactobacillus sp.]|jgi:uncharacterized membrane protein|nr:DUF2335 domain-containing protein [Lactobacillus sp.]MCH4067994.1 DUF2335 domain-containing protein [Lactobacillus sp.]MCI1304050.1 DUF2335 domain-containing protein [Lactobacillus sp.]MCI1329924.1 DUF2335 domain-containing protein [Lactobacillus sp.]MCI1399524.1 DUF2335 domain-containing protein [Lactobacillus sp.]